MSFGMIRIDIGRRLFKLTPGDNLIEQVQLLTPVLDPPDYVESTDLYNVSENKWCLTKMTHVISHDPLAQQQQLY